MLNFVRIDETGKERILHLRVREDQLPFVGSMESILRHKSRGAHCYAIFHGDEPVGFFIIDTHYPQNYPFARKNELGLRSFFIDLKYQKKGYGMQASAMLESFLCHNYPAYNSIALTVNRRNTVAQRCYYTAGFEDTGELYSGPAGMKHIMRMNINCARYD